MKTSRSFIMGENTEIEDMSEFYKTVNEYKKATTSRKSPTFISYKIGEEIANGVVFFGQLKTEKRETTAMCVCPYCREVWRANIGNIRRGNSKSCGCRNSTKK